MPEDPKKKRTQACLLCIISAPVIEYGTPEIIIKESVLAEVLPIYEAHMGMAEFIMWGVAEWGEKDETGFRGLVIQKDKFMEFKSRVEKVRKRMEKEK